MADTTATAAAVALGAAHGLPVGAPQILKDGSNLLVHLAPAPVVVRVATFTGRIRRDPLPYLEREVSLVSALASAGAPVTPPSPLIPPGPHVIDGWPMTALAYVPHMAGGVPAARAAFAALDELHAALASIDIPLPVLGPAMADLDLATAFAVDQGLLDPVDAADLLAARDDVARRLLGATTSRQALHGDAFPGNALIADGRVVWLDFEDACLGPVAWDHAVLVRASDDPTIEAELARRDGAEVLDLAIELRGFQARVWRILHDARRYGQLLPAS